MTSTIAGKEEELHWLALKLIPGLGTRNSGKLLDRFRTPQAIFRASRSELEGAGLSGGVAQSITSGCTFEDAVVQQERMMEAGAVLVTLGDPRYPRPLREIFDPPIALFARGRVELLGFRRTWPTPVLRLSAGWRAASTPPPIRGRSRWAAKPSPCSAAASMWCTLRRTASWRPISRRRG
jgi:hypothetical protein